VSDGATVAAGADLALSSSECFSGFRVHLINSPADGKDLRLLGAHGQSEVIQFQ